ncbi:SDR family NAD(P)-dependent oxidoreductase [Mycolicibacterium vaccae]|uniref:SDR family NAD(P)-dependent oxidoreductase n=1 Tax=Mycolicibacterium vaccae TaxID=1810 RepID=UPI000AD0C26A|nr:SDR family oxidoreductase [Mycolicibacterium vaccae]
MDIPRASVAGRKVLVTGAATGIGAAAVRALVDAEALVAATYHQSEPPEGLPAHWRRCDVRDADDVDEAVGYAVRTLDGLDVVIHAAGHWQPGVPGSLTGDDIERQLATNLKSTIFVNQSGYAAMRQKGGQIINFGSAEAAMGSPMSAVYAAAKGAVHAWTRSAARAWANDGVTVNAVAPAVQTPGADRVREFLGPDMAPLMDQQLQMSIPLGGRLGDPAADVAPVLLFLSSPAARFITGQLLAVDGGLMMVGS